MGRGVLTQASLTPIPCTLLSFESALRCGKAEHSCQRDSYISYAKVAFKACGGRLLEKYRDYVASKTQEYGRFCFVYVYRKLLGGYSVFIRSLWRKFVLTVVANGYKIIIINS